MARGKINPWLKIGLELGPLIAFFVAFARLKDTSVSVGGTEYGGFILATAGFIPLMALSTAALWWLTGRIAPMQIATLVLVVVFGGLSVWLNDERFFKMKPTLIYLLFAGVLGFGLLRGRSYLALVMEEVMPLKPEGWVILTRRLIGFFLTLAVLNEVIWRTMSDQAWVNFKTFGLTGAIFVFFLAQGRLFQRHAIETDES
ncbi:MAG: intracellular septation protein A [Alphaproteobacteria bacterium HGW-Alphaproteobacteria-6]|nr:MAG: intracellular septation protein A [Alphaproteobacteria bacterium HGW-Alphaproteobacteria-6]